MDMSEVLFNELAFLRIMKDLDDPRAVEKIKGKSWFTVSFVFVILFCFLVISIHCFHLTSLAVMVMSDMGAKLHFMQHQYAHCLML